MAETSFDVKLAAIEDKRNAALSLSRSHHFEVSPTYASIGIDQAAPWKNAAMVTFSSSCPAYLMDQVLLCAVDHSSTLRIVTVEKDMTDGSPLVQVAFEHFDINKGKFGIPSRGLSLFPAERTTCIIDLSAVFSHPDMCTPMLSLKLGWEMVGSRYAHSKKYVMHKNTQIARLLSWNSGVRGSFWIPAFVNGRLQCDTEGLLSVDQRRKVKLLAEDVDGGKMELRIAGFSVATISFSSTSSEEGAFGNEIVSVDFEANTDMCPATWDEEGQQWKSPPHIGSSIDVIASYDENLRFTLSRSDTGSFLGRLPTWSCMNMRQVDDFILGSRVFQRLQTSGCVVSVDQSGIVTLSACDDIDGAQREFRRFLRSTRLDLQAVLEAVIVPQAKRALSLFPIFTYSRGDQIMLASKTAFVMCVCVHDITADGLYICLGGLLGGFWIDFW